MTVGACWRERRRRPKRKSSENALAINQGATYLAVERLPMAHPLLSLAVGRTSPLSFLPHLRPKLSENEDDVKEAPLPGGAPCSHADRQQVVINEQLGELVKSA